jgi:hypothetical protein
VIRLLKLADKFDIYGARDVAIEVLTRYSVASPTREANPPFQISATETLILAIQHGVPSWLSPSINILIRSVPQREITESEADSLGTFTLHLLFTCQDEVNEIYRHVGLNAPYQRGILCATVEQASRCKEGWDRYWRDRMPDMLLSDVGKRRALKSVLTAVHQLDYTRDLSTVMCAACSDKSRDYIHSMAPWKLEDGIVQSAVERIAARFHLEC